MREEEFAAERRECPSGRFFERREPDDARTSYMFMDLKKPIIEGANIKGTLTFGKAGNIDVSYKVEAAGASDSTEHMH
jgi:hypothetical protein